MGLISLPVLNKINNSNYWNNIWDSSILFKRYFYLTIFLNKYFQLIFTDYTLNILNKLILKSKLKKGYFLNNYIKKKLIRNFFLGKILILKYQNWYLIIIKLFSSNILKKKKLNNYFKNKKKKNFFKFLFKNINKNNYNNYLNYKNKF